MARGWESKAVEAQMEEALDRFEKGKAASRATPGETSQERRSLLLAKARIVNEIHTTANDRYKNLMESSLVAIDEQLSSLK